MSKNIYRNTRYSKNKGFTLVELVVMIVVQGILAVTAIPKFINLRADAKSENLKSIAGAMQSALQLVYSRALIEGQNLSDAAIDINAIEVRHHFSRINQQEIIKSIYSLPKIMTKRASILTA